MNQVIVAQLEVALLHLLVLVECVQLEVIVNLALVEYSAPVRLGHITLILVLLLLHGVNNVQTDTSAKEMKLP